MILSGIFNANFRVIFFDIPQEEIIQRLSNRLICSNQDCQAIYSLISLAPQRENICDHCEAPLGRREDDRLEVIKERLAHYPMYAEDLLAYYKSVKQPVEVLNINAKSALKVFENFEAIINKNAYTNLDIQ